jgi:hypothetical protein
MQQLKCACHAAVAADKVDIHHQELVVAVHDTVNQVGYAEGFDLYMREASAANNLRTRDVMIAPDSTNCRDDVIGAGSLNHRGGKAQETVEKVVRGNMELLKELPRAGGSCSRCAGNHTVTEPISHRHTKKHKLLWLPHGSHGLPKL